MNTPPQRPPAGEGPTPFRREAPNKSAGSRSAGRHFYWGVRPLTPAEAGPPAAALVMGCQVAAVPPLPLPQQSCSTLGPLLLTRFYIFLSFFCLFLSVAVGRLPEQ